MYILSVAPISRGISKKQLSYYTSKQLAPGALVEIPLRSGFRPAIVLNTKTVSDAKTSLKKASYRLRPIKQVIANQSFSDATLQAIYQTAEWYNASIGALLNHLCPETILKQPPEYFSELPLPQDTPGQAFECLALKASYHNQLEHYSQLIREEFSRKRSLIILTPTKTSAEQLNKVLTKGIEQYCFTFHHEIKKTQLIKNWQRALTEKHPVLIIATRSFMTIPRSDLNTMIIDEEGSTSYEPLDRPFFQPQKTAEFLAHNRRLRLIKSDLTLSVGTFHQLEVGNYHELSPISFRLPGPSDWRIINTSSTSSQERPSEYEQIFSPEVDDLIQRTRNHKTSALLYSARRGLAPTINCDDCQHSLNCENCGKPLALYTTSDKKRQMICSGCRSYYPPIDNCPYCQGNRLTSLGWGTERVEKTLLDRYPEIPVIRMDSLNTGTSRQIDKKIQQFNDTPGSIMICTDMVIPYLNSHLKPYFTAVISLDSLLTRPEYSVQERVFRVLARLRAATTEQCVLQTRNSDYPGLELLTATNSRHFYRQELELRERFSYPPFVVLIKIVFAGHTDQLSQLIRDWEYKLADYSPQTYTPLTNTTARKGEKNHNILIKIPVKNWPDRQLNSILSDLPPKHLVFVNPSSIL